MNEQYNIGDIFYDSDNNRYTYTKTGVESSPLYIEYVNTTAATTTTTSLEYVNTTATTASLESSYIKQYLKNNPELLDELITELRKEKINKILNKKLWIL